MKCIRVDPDPDPQQWKIHKKSLIYSLLSYLGNLCRRWDRSWEHCWRESWGEPAGEFVWWWCSCNQTPGSAGSAQADPRSRAATPGGAWRRSGTCTPSRRFYTRTESPVRPEPGVNRGILYIFKYFSRPLPFEFIPFTIMPNYFVFSKKSGKKIL